RYRSPEVFKLEDRSKRPFVLPLSHEESMTFHALEIKSYRELPQIWYHFQTKDRDEPRPRGGLIRVREVIMKDSYSFDRNGPRLDAPQEVETPGVTTIDALADLLGVDAAATSKAMPLVTEEGAVVLCLIRGDDKLNEEKALRAAGTARPATDEEIQAAFGADP